MEPTVTAMCSQVRKVRSFAKKVLGSMRMGVVQGAVRSAGIALGALNQRSRKLPMPSGFFLPNSVPAWRTSCLRMHIGMMA